MSEMIARVAEAIKAEIAKDEDVFSRDDGKTAFMIDGHVNIEAVARAAIDALRNPSHEMMGAMFEAMFEAKFDGTDAPMMGAGFEAAIDAALKETGQ